MSGKTFAYFRKDTFVSEGYSVFCHVDPDCGEKTKRILFDDCQASEVPTDAKRLDADYANPDAERRICAWLTNDGVMHVWTDADRMRITDECRMMFAGMDNVSRIDTSRFDTSKMTDMSYMFSGCKELTSLDLSSFDTSQVTDMNQMFDNCPGLKSLDLSSFDTSKVTDMSWMFVRSASLTSLDVSSFDTSQVTDMSYMFYDCSGLTSLNVSSFDTSKVTNMRRMFSGCSGLASLDLSSFEVSDETAMNETFSWCSGLKVAVGDRWKRSNDVPGVSIVRKGLAKRRKAARDERER